MEVRVFHKNGNIVFPVVRSIESLTWLKDMFKEKCHPIYAVISNDESVKELASRLSFYTNSVDIVINNEGIPGETDEIENVTTKELMDLYNVHCLGGGEVNKQH